MSYLFFAITGYLLNSIAVTVDKFLLSDSIPDPLVYVFYFSLASLLSLLVVPFVPNPSLDSFITASLSTLLWTTGAYFMFKALQIGQVSRVIPLIGTLIPLLLLFQAISAHTVTINQTWAVGLLIIGMVFITLPDWKGKISKKEILLIIFSAIFYAVSYLLLNLSYQQASNHIAHHISKDAMSVGVLVYSRFILIPVGLGLIAIPALRRKVLIKNQNKPKIQMLSKIGLLFAFGQLAGGSSGLFINFAISKATPALVNSLQGIQYAFLFCLSLILARKFPKIFHEKISRLNLLGKILGIVFISFGLFILSYESTPISKKPLFGVTYSPRYAKQLGLDPITTYKKMITDLQPKSIRLPLYWDQVEPKENIYSFADSDFYVNYAESKNVNLILVVGFKQPRWPECYAPDWVNKLTGQERTGALLHLVDAEINHYKKYQNIKVWQVENEPFLGFGMCPPPDPEGRQLHNEVSLVKSIDSRPILITDSGELSPWTNAFQSGDIFGTTLYRTVWNQYLGMVDYPLPPFFYEIKSDIVKLLTNNSQKKTIISELQAEPWQTQAKELKDINLQNQINLFPPKKLKQNVDYAIQTHFPQVYLWGVEWWYFMDKNGYPQYLNEAKDIFIPKRG